MVFLLGMYLRCLASDLPSPHIFKVVLFCVIADSFDSLGLLGKIKMSHEKFSKEMPTSPGREKR